MQAAAHSESASAFVRARNSPGVREPTESRPRSNARKPLGKPLPRDAARICSVPLKVECLDVDLVATNSKAKDEVQERRSWNGCACATAVAPAPSYDTPVRQRTSNTGGRCAGRLPLNFPRAPVKSVKIDVFRGVSVRRRLERYDLGRSMSPR